MVKKTLLILLCIGTFVGCGQRNAKKNESAPVAGNIAAVKPAADSIHGAYLSLDKSRYDFGKVNKNKTPLIPIEFMVENIGKEPLVILKADVSCGCLSTKFSTEPILPGEKSLLMVYIDTKSQEGNFNKSVFIKSNAENDVELIRIVGEVKK